MSSPAAAVPRLSEAPAEVQRLLAKDICTGIVEAQTQRLLAEQRRAQERVDRVVDSALKELPPALLAMKAQDALALESIQVLTRAVAASASGQSMNQFQEPAEPRQIYPRTDSTTRSNAEAELRHHSAVASATSGQGSDCSHMQASASARAVVAAGATPLGVSAAGSAGTPQSMRLAAAREKAAQSSTRSSVPSQLPSPSAAQLPSPAASSTAGGSSFVEKQQYMEELSSKIAKLDDAKDLMSITQQQMEKLPPEKRRAVIQRTSQMINRVTAAEGGMEEDENSPTS